MAVVENVFSGYKKAKISMSTRIDTQHVIHHFNSIAADYERWKEKSSYYYNAVIQSLRHMIPPGKRILELGCGTGAILDSLTPSYGLGIDISPEMIAYARQKRPHLQFEVADIEQLQMPQPFDYVVLVDLVEHLCNLEGSFRNLWNILPPKTIIISSSVNPLWAPILHIAERFGLKMPEGGHRWPSLRELTALIDTLGFNILHKDRRIILPKRVPFLSDFLNQIYPHRGPLAHLCLIQIIAFEKPFSHKSEKLPVSAFG